MAYKVGLWPVLSLVDLPYQQGANFRVAYEAQGSQQGLWPIHSLVNVAYQVGAKFRVAYQECLWILAHT